MNELSFGLQFLIGMLAHMKAIDFCILISYPGVLLNFLMSSNSLLVDSLGAYW